ncbi:hypothetical protein [Alloscardovia criceti]|uniref:hypothetical protein n=1 Tax=Alloscardovia criceti TaxID=356828 RepID=UPI000381671B|nr:hypothetical protein [Alloscardovia criceti]
MAAAEARSIRSTRSRSYSAAADFAASPSTRPSTRTGSYGRPQPRVTQREETRSTLHVISTQARPSISRKSSVIVFVSSIIFLVISLMATLAMRTSMTENAFAISETQNSVTQLTQDVQQDRAKLNDLQSQLPERALEMGMQQGSSSMTIDLGNAQ